MIAGFVITAAIIAKGLDRFESQRAGSGTSNAAYPVLMLGFIVPVTIATAIAGEWRIFLSGLAASVAALGALWFELKRRGRS